MGMTTPHAVFFHIPKTGGTWVESSIKRAFGGRADKMNVDVGWDLPINGIHIPPTKVEFKKFSYTFVRHPIPWWQSYWKLNSPKSGLDFDEYVEKHKGLYTWIVKQFEGVDFIGRTENLAFDLEDALLEAGEEFDPDKFHVQRINVSMAPDAEWKDKTRNLILKHDKYVIDKYYEGKKQP
jgi:hypothetical protein